MSGVAYFAEIVQKTSQGFGHQWTRKRPGDCFIVNIATSKCACAPSVIGDSGIALGPAHRSSAAWKNGWPQLLPRENHKESASIGAEWSDTDSGNKRPLWSQRRANRRRDAANNRSRAAKAQGLCAWPRRKRNRLGMARGLSHRAHARRPRAVSAANRESHRAEASRCQGAASCQRWSNAPKRSPRGVTGPW